jgi:hypothetical protein
MAWTSRQSWAAGLVPVGLGLADGLDVGLPDPVELGEGEADADFDGLLLGLVEALLLGEDDALPVALGVAVALVVALAVGLAFAVALAEAEALAVAEALVLAEGEAELLAFFLGAFDTGSEATSRTTAVWPAGTVRAADVAAGGWPHRLGAATLAVLASAAVPPRRLPAIPEDTMAALATMPSAEAPDREGFMAAPSLPWSSWLRPRVNSQIASDRPDAGTIPSCRSSTPALQ